MFFLLGDLVASLAKMFGGILLIAAGIAIIYESSILHLIEFFTIIGVISIIIGAFLLLLLIFERNASSKPKNPKLIPKGNSNAKRKNVGLESRKNKPNKGNIANLTNSIDTKKFADKVRDISKNNDPRDIFQPNISAANENTKKYNFTPNYEKPVKVTRRPKKRNQSNLNNINISSTGGNNEISELNNLNNPPEAKSEKITRALSSDDFIEPIHNGSKSNPTPNNKDGQDTPNNISEKGFNTNTNDNVEEKNLNNNINDSLNNNKSSKFLSSFVVCSKGTMTSKEAFDELSKSAKSKISLEMASIKDMAEDFLSKISHLDTRMIIQEFDIKDKEYILLITSLIEQGVEIRTLPIINTINLISDDSHALIISENDSPDNLDIGAVYNDSKSISNVKSMFEMSWGIANDLDIDNIGKGFE